MLKNELPIFYDQGMRRWKRVKVFLATLGISVLSFLLTAVPATLSIAPVTSLSANGQNQPPSALKDTGVSASLADELSAKNLPVIGEGPLIRVIKVQGSNGMDPFTNANLANLSQDDQIKVSDQQYAIQRYGQAQQKQIALTFDDGPNPTYTPQLLDLLSQKSASATFFVVGKNVVQYPEITQRIVHEGHTLGNHSLTHANLEQAGQFKALQEINQNERVIRAVANRSTSFFRPPYNDNTDQGMRNGLRSMLLGQQLGYVITSYNYDTRDWSFTSRQIPDISKLNPNQDHIVLMHDGGGDRNYTLQYVSQFIDQARAAGYTFVSLDQLYPNPPLYRSAQPGFQDQVAFNTASILNAWPKHLAITLFFISVVLIFISIVVNTVLAALNHRKSAKKKWPRYEPHVTAVIAAYNEERVLDHTVKAMLASDYKKLSVIIVDDGSTDGTHAKANKLARKYKQVTALTQPNGGKSSALNFGIQHAKTDIVVCADADTVFDHHAIHNLVRHFKNKQVGAVAGTVKVGNAVNGLAKWQMLEYLISVHVERNAQAYLDAIMIVPGACSAWRRKAILKAGGYSHATLAEDCDLTLTVRKAGYKIVQDNDAIAYTECPLLLVDLAKQRFRWVFGNVQSFWKHRDMFFNLRYGWLGSLMLPNAVLSIVLALIFWPILVALTINNLSSGNYQVLLIFLGATVIVQFIAAFGALILAKESLKLLIVVPMTRFVYGPLRTYLLYRVLLTVLRGAYVGWNKLTRSGTVRREASGG